jgi:hypothetical protein
MKVGLSTHQPVCVCVCVCVPPIKNFWTERCISMNFGRQAVPLKMTSMPQFFNLVASAVPRWRTINLLRWVQRNPLITFQPISRFGWNLVRRWRHWSWPRLHNIQCRSFNHSKMVDVWISEMGATFEKIGGFGWTFLYGGDDIEYCLL